MYILNICCSALSAGKGGGVSMQCQQNILLKNIWLNNES